MPDIRKKITVSTDENPRTPALLDVHPDGTVQIDISALDNTIRLWPPEVAWIIEQAHHTPCVLEERAKLLLDVAGQRAMGQGYARRLPEPPSTKMEDKTREAIIHAFKTEWGEQRGADISDMKTAARYLDAALRSVHLYARPEEPTQLPPGTGGRTDSDRRKLLADLGVTAESAMVRNAAENLQLKRELVAAVGDWAEDVRDASNNQVHLRRTLQAIVDIATPERLDNVAASAILKIAQATLDGAPVTKHPKLAVALYGSDRDHDAIEQISPSVDPVEHGIEQTFWQFDHLRKRNSRPMDERSAFKLVLRRLLSRQEPQPYMFQDTPLDERMLAEFRVSMEGKPALLVELEESLAKPSSKDPMRAVPSQQGEEPKEVVDPLKRARDLQPVTPLPAKPDLPPGVTDDHVEQDRDDI